MGITQKHCNIMPSFEYHLKGIKSFVGREGAGFLENLYHLNKKVAAVMDDASEGNIYIKAIHENDDRNDGDEEFMLDIKLDKRTFVDKLFSSAMGIKDLRKDLKKHHVVIANELEKGAYFRYNKEAPIGVVESKIRLESDNDDVDITFVNLESLLAPLYNAHNQPCAGMKV